MPLYTDVLLGVSQTLFSVAYNNGQGLDSSGDWGELLLIHINSDDNRSNIIAQLPYPGW